MVRVSWGDHSNHCRMDSKWVGGFCHLLAAGVASKQMRHAESTMLRSVIILGIVSGDVS